jgi:ligand-binding SRPBCC domain-containing protein
VAGGEVHSAPSRQAGYAESESMSEFVQSVEIAVSVEKVFKFHEREDALPLLTPSFPPVRLVAKTPGIEKGTRVELKVGPFPWIALHTDFRRNALFVDEQIQGPFAEWIHRHEFESIGDHCRMTDRVRYRLPGGSLVNWLLRWPVELGLRQMFSHRHAVTKRLCEDH